VRVKDSPAGDDKSAPATTATKPAADSGDQ
jgi:hypothetical protein